MQIPHDIAKGIVTTGLVIIGALAIAYPEATHLLQTLALAINIVWVWE